jgi:DNA-binding YbaB/EbfC family protein
MNLQKMMKQAQEMQAKVAQMQARMESQVVDGSAGGGMVTVQLSGKSDILKVNIDASLFKPEEKEMVEDLLIAAYRDAREKIDATSAEEMSKLSAGLNLPPGMKLPF